MRETRIFSKRLVTPEGLVCGEVVLGDAAIVAVEPSSSASSTALDWGEDFLTPGLVDLHTDNLEKHYQPRPGALWDAYGAALAHDGQCAAAGITTVLDSLALHGSKDGLNRKDALAPMISAMDAARSDGVLRADHFLHLRCEITDGELLNNLLPYVQHPRLKLLSMMDHTPGQRQTADVGRLRAQLSAGGRTDAEVEAFLTSFEVERTPDAVASNRRSIVGFATEHRLPLAAHDDATDDHVHEAHADGCVIAEFPVTLEAARAARRLEMSIVMGGPNFVRGGSHSGNLSARAAADADLLDVIASDYVPLSMLRTAFLLIDDYAWPAEKALAVVARNPARCVGLDDRGEIAPGQCADLLRVFRNPVGWPAPTEVWREGRRVA